jgi:hypothetical protein
MLCFASLVYTWLLLLQFVLVRRYALFFLLYIVFDQQLHLTWVTSKISQKIQTDLLLQIQQAALVFKKKTLEQCKFYCILK